MERKIIYIIIGVFLIAIIGVSIFVGITAIQNGENPNSQVSSNDIESNLTLKLTPNKTEEDVESVTINAIAKTIDESEIKLIILPDGTEKKNTNKASYKVTENGSYEFKAESENGEEVTETIEISNIAERSSKNPYIPKGFSYVEGEVDNGYTIEDDYGNQFVWIPVESGKAIRNNASKTNFEDTDSFALELVNSVAQNYGFYVAKYEASEYEVNGNIVAASMSGADPITNITYLEAADMAQEAADLYEYENCITAIMSSYAWDTILNWIDENNEGYSSDSEAGNYSEEVMLTGETESDIKNNICDLAGNLREWTTEVYKSKKEDVEETNSTNNSTNETVIKDTSKYRVVRGGSANLDLPASRRDKYKENKSNDYWGFRMVLYKK